MNTILLFAQCALFGAVVELQFPITAHPLEFLALVVLNAVLVVAYGATNND